jgi:putative spermidine/putrescine transport system substrate-binding protein
MHRSVILAAAALLAAASPALAQQLGKSEASVDIVAWPGYIERGETDKAYDWVTAFEKETGCKVNVKTAATSSPPPATRASASCRARRCSR